MTAGKLLSASSADTDAELIRRSRHESDAFSIVFERHAPAIYRYAIRRLGDAAAEDVVAETFLAAFRHRNRYDLTRESARPWLFGIAGNVIGRQRRTEVRLLKALARTGVDEVVESYADRVETRVVAAKTGPALAGALAALSRGERDVLLLVAWADFNCEEAAEALAIPAGTARSRLHRARKKVRAALGGSNPTAIDKESSNG